jgi:hypothetical protein
MNCSKQEIKMRITRDPKAMAKTLRADLASHGIDLGHSQCLELVAHQLGFADWNTTAAFQETAQTKPLPELKLPHGWKVSGTQARDYAIGLDDKSPGRKVTIRSIEKDAPYVGFATLMQSIAATAFIGKRLRLTAQLRTKDVPDAATLWMRVDDGGKRMVAFDNMEERGAAGVLSGTVDWQTRDIVLDVPAAAVSIHYGFYLRGAGQCWARDFDLQTIAIGVQATTSEAVGPYLGEPTNLAFSA